jgi:Ca2+-binding RTX toxin-like protein
VQLTDGELTFNEADLSCGPVTQTGVFTVNAADGLQSLLVGGLAVISAGVVAGFPLSTQTALGNTFSVTGYDLATGEVSYSYTLQGAADHPAGDGTNMTGESFAVVAHDVDGDSANGTVNIHIVDDVPQAQCIEVTLSADPCCPGAPLPGASGSLLQGGSFGADGGFIRSISVDGTTYRYDPQSGLCVSSCEGAGVFDPATGSLTITSDGGGTLVVNMLNGDFSYTPSGQPNCEPLTENIHYVISDNDGDLAGADLQINVPATLSPEGPKAVADNVITNILAPCIEVPGTLLLTNDSSGNGDPLSASPTLFHTGWQAKGEGFSNDCLKTIDFSGKRNTDANQLKNLERSDFTNTGAMTALVVLSGYLGAFNGPAANAQDLYSVNLVAGESVTVDLKGLGDQVGVLWQLDGGEFQLLDAGGTFTATENGVYRILLVNQPDAGQPGPGGHYTLDLSIDYSAAITTPTYESDYTAHDGHGGSDSAPVNISYQEGCTLLGTTGDDVLLGGAQDDSLHGGNGNDVLSGGAGNNDLYGDNGDDILFSGQGNEVLDGGAGNNTASYALAESGVTVSTAQLGPQHTGGAGTDTLINIQNLIGSDYNDHLTGDYEANTINGGLGNDVLVGGLGNDTLMGGAGNDTFKWLAGDTGHDLVTDFRIGADTLDLSKLLQGFGAAGDSLDDVLHFKVTGNGADLVSTIEVGAGGDSTQSIDLAGVDLAHHYGVGVGAGGMVSGADAGSIINGMLGDHSLRADVA